jgi:hypothetical protein
VISEAARTHFNKSAVLPNDEEIWSWLDLVRDRISSIAGKRDLTRRDFAATLVIALATPTDTVICHIGDGAAVCRAGDEWIVASWPENGEYASTTFFVTDDPSPKLNIVRLGRAVDAVALFSDGLERLALQFSDRTAFTPFFENLLVPMRQAKEGSNPKLNASLRRYLDSPRINERTDDDKSLVLAVRV